jgi:hypothetical protein
MMDKDLEKVISRIQKLFELAGNNPSKQEAISASLKAQELMAKYNLPQDNLATEHEPEIIKLTCNLPKGYGSFKYNLVDVISRNFACKHCYYGKGIAVFYGYKQNTIAAKMTFQYLFKICHTLGLRLSDHMAYVNHSCKGIYANYTFGFVEGVKQEMEKQCRALQIVTPVRVVESFNEMVADWKTINLPGGVSSITEDFYKGMKDGANAVASRRIGETK